jgi:hypothetical protein
MVIDSLNKGELNHATASYNLLVLPWGMQYSVVNEDSDFKENS